MLELLIILALVAIGAAAVLVARRRLRRQRRDALLGEVAEIFHGQLLPAPRAASQEAVRFSHEGNDFTLRREERARGQVVERCCVVEVSPELYSGPPLELLGRGEHASHLLPAQVEQVTIGDHADRHQLRAVTTPENAERVRALLADRELGRLVSYALDKRGARIHLSARAVWFECSGFPGDAELVASIARTAAEVLTRLLRAAPAVADRPSRS